MDQPRRQKHDLDTRLTPKDIKNYDNVNDVGKCNFWSLSDMEINILIAS